ncbi:MAG TPA: class I SAM-dependent methyltransferase [Nitrososphaera sp.]|nr:class I SAM-dependent methyltransferase [Nitrososphaera sp.]
MAAGYDPVKYKISSIQNWNAVAPGYHSDWASKGRGPFRSTAELVKAAGIRPADSVLDVACGTGAVSMQAARLLGPSGTLVGIDFSSGALAIARSSVPAGHFAEMDAENIGLGMRFDRILCQYALMFFPDPVGVLRRLWALLKNGGRLAVAVHGTPAGVPYFSTIMEQVVRHVPDIRPEGTPTVHRFGNAADLQDVIAGAGFSGVSIKEFIFDYEAGTFGEYWSDYMSTTANSIRAMIEGRGPGVVSAIRAEAEEKARKFMENGRIRFPWQVLVATATRAQD